MQPLPICHKEAEWLQIELAKKHREKEERLAKKMAKKLAKGCANISI
jgi:hypothetical protein